MKNCYDENCVYCNDECDCEEEINEDIEIIEEIVEELASEFEKNLENLKDGECPCCLLRELLTRTYLIGHDDGVKLLAHNLGRVMDDIVEEL